MRAQSYVSRVAAVLLFSLAFIFTSECSAQTPRRQSAAVDPHGNPLPSREEQRARLEQLLGRPVQDYPTIQTGPAGAAAAPYDGADNPVAYTNTNPGALVQPTPDDLAETPDVKFTPEVKSLAARLGADPQKLYLYVKNVYTFTPYFGSQKGSQGTELEFAGNDYDQASLLIALLRASGIPARYVFGSMYIDTEKALNWLQVDSPAAAVNVLRWQGIPAQFVKAGGGSLLVDRVWVEALIDRHGPNPRWVPMDPAFKQYKITPASPLAAAVAFDQNAFLHLPLSDRRTPYEFLASNLQSYLNTAAPGTTVADVVRSTSIVPTVFLKGLPGRVENRARHRSEATELTDAQRYLVGVLTVDAQGVSAQTTFRLPEIYSQRVTISFPPATSADQALVQSSGGYYNAPADQLHVVASINVNGQAVATGSRPAFIGDGHYVVVDLFFPGATQPATLFHTVFAGGYYGLGLDVQGDLSEEISARKQSYLQALNTSPDPTYDDATTGDFMSTTALVYLNNIQAERLNISALTSTTPVMDVSEALTMKNIVIEYVNGGWHFRPFGWTIDAKRVASNLFADNGDDSHQIQWLQMDGVASSFYESRLWDRFTGIQSISTIRGLQLANANGIPVYQIDQTNAAALLPTLNVFPDVLQNVQNEVNAGHTVTIPRDTIVMNQWVGSVWIDELPDGSAGYLIEGGLFGGSTTQDPKDRQNTNPSCSDLDAALDSQSGNFDSDIARAVAMRESGWTQFDGDGDPLISQNKNKSGQVTSADIGIMQVNDNNDGQTVTLPDGTHVVIDQQRLANDWQYNVQIGSAILNNDLIAAQRYLLGLGVSSPSNSDLATVAYYMYNHGSNVPPGFDYQNGVLTPISYEVGDTFTYNGKTRTVTQGVLDGQQNALAVQNIFNNQSWLNAKKGCHP
jgi:transglutaminase-like putative cysteine protease